MDIINFEGLEPEALGQLSDKSGLKYFSRSGSTLRRLRATTFSVTFNTNYTPFTKNLGLDMEEWAKIKEGEIKRDLREAILEAFEDLKNNERLYENRDVSNIVKAEIKSMGTEVGKKLRRIHAHFTLKVWYYVNNTRKGSDKIVQIDFQEFRDAVLEILRRKHPEIKGMAFFFRVTNQDKYKKIFYQQKDVIDDLMNDRQLRQRFLNSIEEAE